MKSQLLAVNSYVAFDTETTGVSIYFDELLEIGAVLVEDGVIADTFQIFSKPQRHREWPAAEFVNHISPAMVANACTPNEAAEQFLAWVGDRVLVGHNAAGFDSIFIANALGHEIDNALVDTLRLARNLAKSLENKKLGTVYDLATKNAAPFDITSLGSPHRAAYDSGMTACIYEYFKGEIPALAEAVSHRDRGFTPQIKADSTKYRQHIFQRIEAIQAGNVLFDQDEANALVDDIEDFPETLKGGDIVMRSLYEALLKSAETPTLADDEKQSILCQIDKLLNPIVDKPELVDVNLEGNLFAFSGNFVHGTKNEVMQMVKARGGKVRDGDPTMKTSYLVIGDNRSGGYSYGGFGGKVLRAVELNLTHENVDIKIISETVLFETLNK